MSIRTLNLSNGNSFQNQTWRHENEPASPTCSVFSSFSSVANKSSTDIKHILKKAFHSIAEKERDLKLAAEVGKTLLENNTLLEQKYRTLQDECHMQYDQSTQHFQHKLKQSEQVITTLETQNAELQEKYETILKSKEKINQQISVSQQKATMQVNELYQSLEKAYETIHEHEQYRQEYIKNLVVQDVDPMAPNTLTSETTAADHNYTELTHKMEYMLSQNEALLESKKLIEQQVGEAIAQLTQLSIQFNQVQQNKEQFHLLEAKFQSQENHIQQLTSVIENYQFNLVHDCHHDTMPSLITGTSSSDEDEEMHDHLLLDSPQPLKGNSLFSELQLASNQELYALDPIHASTSEKGRKSRRRSMYPKLRRDASLIAPLPAYRSSNQIMVSRKSKASNYVFHSAIQLPINSMYFIWRCFRFFIVIQLAMIIHLFYKIK